MNKCFILNFTPIGIISTKTMLAIQPKEIAQDIPEAVDLGAKTIHIYACDTKTGQPSQDIKDAHDQYAYRRCGQYRS